MYSVPATHSDLATRLGSVIHSDLVIHLGLVTRSGSAIQ